MKFHKPDVEKLLGIKGTRLHEWIKFGYIKKFVAPGHGYKYELELFDLYTIVFLENLIAQGIPRQYAGEMAQLMRKHVEKKKLQNNLPKYFAFGEKLSETKPKVRTGVTVTSFNEYKEQEINWLGQEFDNIIIVNFYKITKEVDAKV